ncbi:RDD family protein [Helicobacter fennelliae]|mgnify:CR=1 FL=1|uniref:RDD domain-containing protein n=2 Tax=Helicobacter fennelliae TaxID=215 RepID=T1DUV8_9HELI|nr:RDD family protein [Helicobacter fennelliae]GAD18243.1 hypothetical protein HFN_1841 [Helicobacter fennelliae MRY12-0050]SQB97975.1 RDD family protein [Helicobacter fennelliae]STP06815.1 RDD family protein [Helicobacter fennelliae]STQ83632.1 RDD family protein [Helicobacter fennelliae]
MQFNDDKIQEILDREDIFLAPLDKRFFAFLIDAFLIDFLIVFVLFDEYRVAFDTNNIESVIQVLQPMVIQILCINVVYHTIFVALYGASLGKMICKIQVIRLDTLDMPNFAISFLRALLRQFSLILYCIPFLFAFGDVFRRTLYDRACKTIVICRKK